MARLRRASLPGYAAAFAVLLQVLLLADHVAAQASRASLGALAPGILQLCVGSPDGAGGAGENGGVSCPVCVSAACQTALYAPPPAVVAHAAPRFVFAEWRPVPNALAPVLAREAVARGPPVLSA
jgi:hypothetical protein